MKGVGRGGVRWVGMDERSMIKIITKNKKEKLN